jgi:transcriptional regulator with XRE-family HTH domain
MSGWWDYVVRVSGTSVQKSIATKSGIGETAFSRWKQGKNLPPEALTVINFARSYGRPPVEALVAAGYLTSEEAADVIELEPSVDDLPLDVLLDAIRRRAGNPDRHRLAPDPNADPL